MVQKAEDIREEQQGRRQFLTGMWVGIDDLSGEALILTEEGPRRARTVRRVEDPEKYDLELLSKVRGLPKADAEEE